MRRTRKFQVEGRCRRPATQAEGRGGHRRHTYASAWPKVSRTAAYGCNGHRRRWAKVLGLGLREDAPNRYDRWDQHIREVSDEPTVQKHERRSNRRISSALE
jgi:hypothetical protein